MNIVISRYVRTAGVLLLVLSFAFAPLTQALADNPHTDFPNNPNVSICHATGSENNPYSDGKQEVDANAIINGNGNSDKGHGDHEGDIIPEFDYDLGDGPQHYPGKNLDNGGQEILENDCEVPETPETITVVFQKVVEGNDAFDADDFSFNVSDNDEVDETVDSGNSIELEAGSYVVTEEYTKDGYNPEDWEVEWSGACEAGQDTDGSLYIDVDDIDLIDGNLTCTVTNTYVGEGDGGEGNNPTDCRIGDNLLLNADFENSDVTNGAGWDIFTSGIDWLVSWVNPNDATPSLELHGGVNGWLPFTGSQYAELDGDTEGPSGSTSGESASTRIAQTVTTVPGAEYKLSYYFSARPGSDTSDNELDVLVAGDSVDTMSADGSALSNTDWTLGEYTFTATTTSTEIAFADLGDSDSIGTFLDNTALCMVKEAPVEQCSITIVSDESNLVEGDVDGDAELVTFIHDLWDAVIPGASWIWGDDPFSETDPTATTTQTFVKTFNWNGPVTSAVLDLAADNSYVVYLNGNEVAADPTESNHFTADSYDLSGDIEQGLNTLEIEVTNWQQNGGTQTSNPAGLLYKLVVTGTDEDCGEEGEGGNNGRYTLTVVTSGEGEGVVTSDEEEGISCDSNGEENVCQKTYPAGTVVNLTATPDEGSNFDNSWAQGAGTCTGNNTPCSVTLNSDIDLNAHFDLNGDSSSTSGGGGGGGGGQRISLRQGGNDNDEGEVLGAQTSVLPVGAPNAGEGGTSSTGLVALLALIGFVGSALFITRTQN